MHIHILGICGTFMGGIAVLARQAGHKVTGCDANVYPPMSTQLQAQGIDLISGYEIDQLKLKPDVFVIGNAITRGNALMEEILNRNLAYISGPQWLAENVLRDKWVLAVAGTHGKTTTSAMLSWILEYAKLEPGFLVGGVPENFGVSAKLGKTPFFVVEADEYDTAFFDKRSKFVHYRPRTAILNNLEFDHADIFRDLAAIELQFHHLVRTIASNGLIVANGYEESMRRALQLGCWTPVEYFGVENGWEASPQQVDGSFDIHLNQKHVGTLKWELLGRHNQYNALAAIAAARHAGVTVADALQALAQFKNVKRRMEVKGTVNGVTVYDDFAHHPTAIQTTLEGLRDKVGKARILAVVEPRSNTMRMGLMKDSLAGSLGSADKTFCYNSKLGWDVATALAPLGSKVEIHEDLESLLQSLVQETHAGDQVVIMSNGAFGGIHDKLLRALQEKAPQ